MNKIKVVVTIGPLSKDKEVIKELILKGADVVRINLSYATHTFCREVISEVKELNRELGSNIGIMFDLNGPVVRCGKFIGGSATYKTGDKIRIYMTDIIGDNTKLSVDYPELIDDVRLDDVIKLQNGTVSLKVLEKGSDCLICEVLNGGEVKSHKSLKVIDEKLTIPFLRPDDIKNIDFANEMNIDYLSLSYVENGEDVMNVTDKLIEYGNDHMEVIAKIDRAASLEYLDEITKLSNGVMLDRSELSSEIPMERIPAIQKKMIGMCHRMGKVSIVSTDMESLTEENDDLSRAEVSDIVNAVMDGTDAVLLSGETASAKYPVETVKVLERVIKEAELDIDYESLADEAERTEDEDITGMIAINVTSSANKLRCKAIIIPTVSGYTARKISRFRPSCPIIAVSPNEDTVSSLALHFGVTAVLIDELNSLDKIIKVAEKVTRELIDIKEGDKIIVTGGYPFKETKNTNFMKIEEL